MVLLLTLARLVTPLLVFHKPRLGIFLALFFDSFDYQFFPRNGDWYPAYAQWDKFMDAYQSVVYVWYMYREWKSPLSKRLGYVLFSIRMIGIVLFELTAVRFFLFLFPDIFNNFFLFKEYARGSSNKFLSSFTEIPVLAVIMVLGVMKIIQEYFVHVRQVLPWQMSYGQIMQGEGNLPLLINSSAWVLIFIGAHMMTFWLLVKHRRRQVLSASDLSLYIFFEHFILLLCSETYDNRRTFAPPRWGVIS